MSTPPQTDLPFEPQPQRHNAREDVYGVTTGCMMLALGVHLLHQAHLITGGVAGLALLLSYALPATPGTLFAVLNLPIFLIFWRSQGVFYTIRSVIATLAISGIITLVAHEIVITSVTPLAAAIIACSTASAPSRGVGIRARQIRRPPSSTPSAILVPPRSIPSVATRVLQQGARLGLGRLGHPDAHGAGGLGQDAGEIEGLWDRLFRATLPYGRKGVALHALSAIDLALWDLAGKAAGKPVYELLGGPVKPDIPVYASALHPVGAEKVQAEAKAYVEEGYQAMKMRFPYGPGHGIAGMRANEEHVANVRDAVGDDIEIMADAYMGWVKRRYDYE